MDYDMLEEDQMMRAIAMSLGQDVANAPADDQVKQEHAFKTNQELKGFSFAYFKQV